MRHAIGVMTVCLITGCAVNPPKPPVATGEYRPINQFESKPQAGRNFVIQKTFDFRFDGDIVQSLDALRAVLPQLIVIPPLGTASPLPVHVNLRETTLENALRAIGEQGGEVADVVLKTTNRLGGEQVFIRFRTQDEQPNGAASTPSAVLN